MGFVVAQHVRSVFTQDFVEVCRNSGGSIDHGVAEGTCLVALRRFDPHSFQTKCGFACGNAFQLAIHMTRIDRQLTADFDFALATHHAFEHDVVSVWVDVQVITDTHGLNQEAQLGRQFFTHAFDAGHQLAASFSVDQGNQAVTNFQTN